MRVCEVMSHSPTCCVQSWTAQMAARLMLRNDIGFLPVIESETQRCLTGVLTDRDVCIRVVAPGRDPARVLVQECMTASPIVCSPDDKVERALRLMESYMIRRLPVVDGEQCITGVLSLTDVMHHVAANTREIYVVLSRICEPRRSGQQVDPAMQSVAR